MNETQTGRIYLIGFMGVGKTTIGKKLARRLGYKHVDTDKMIEERVGMPVQEIFRHLGESVFREIESAVLRETYQLEKVVISTGGGLPMTPGHLPGMKSNGIVVYLKAAPGLLEQRLRPNIKSRPLLKNVPEHELYQVISDLLTLRTPVYSDAHVQIELPVKSVETLVKSIGLA